MARVEESGVSSSLPGTEEGMLRMAAQVERFETGRDDELVALTADLATAVHTARG